MGLTSIQLWGTEGADINAQVLGKGGGKAHQRGGRGVIRGSRAVGEPHRGNKTVPSVWKAGSKSKTFRQGVLSVHIIGSHS